jgi:hypothetical protein
MSLRAELVHLGLRWFVKRKIGPVTTLEALRRQDAFLERLVPPPPKGTHPRRGQSSRCRYSCVPRRPPRALSPRGRACVGLAGALW